jgi:hypothetical protein
MYDPRPYISRGLRRQPFASLHKNEIGLYTREKSWRPKKDWLGRRLESPHSPPSLQLWNTGERFRPSGYTATLVYCAHNTIM